MRAIKPITIFITLLGGSILVAYFYDQIDENIRVQIEYYWYWIALIGMGCYFLPGVIKVLRIVLFKRAHQIKGIFSDENSAGVHIFAVNSISNPNTYELTDNNGLITIIHYFMDNKGRLYENDIDTYRDIIVSEKSGYRDEHDIFNKDSEILDDSTAVITKKAKVDVKVRLKEAKGPEECEISLSNDLPKKKQKKGLPNCQLVFLAEDKQNCQLKYFESGVEKWNYKCKTPVENNWKIVNETLFFVSPFETLWDEGLKIYALKLKTGELIAVKKI